MSGGDSGRTEAVRLAAKARKDYRHAKLPHHLMDAARHIPDLTAALSASLDRERELKEQLEAESVVQALLRDENEELRWFYENMREVDLHNLKMRREAESARPERGGNPEGEA